MNPSTPSSSTQGGAPAWGSTPNYEGNLQSSISALAPLAPTWHGAQNGVPIAHQITVSSSSSGSSDSFLPAFWNKVTDVAGQTASMAGGAAQWIGTQLKDAAMAPLNFRSSIQSGLEDRITADSISKQTQDLNQVQSTLMADYKSGRISSQSYAKAMNDLANSYQDLSKQASNLDSKTNTDQQNATKYAISTTVDVLAFMTGNIGAGLSSPEMVAANSAAAETLMGASQLARGAAVIDQLANSEAAWSALSPLAQNAMRVATTEALQSAAASTTVTQITKAAAADLLLKFPLYFNAIDGTGQQLYSELSQNKYGDAITTLALNAALMFSGGPIGWGLKQLKSGYTDAMVALGLRPGSILDEFSSRIGTGDRLALGKIAQEQLQNGNKADVKAMIVGLESNLRAAGGNSAAAVNRIVDHLSNYIGWGDLHNMNHQQAWDNMINYWKHAVGLQDLKAAGKIEGMAANDARVVVPGRFSTQDKNAIAEAVTKGDLALSQREPAYTLIGGQPWMDSVEKQIANAPLSQEEIASGGAYAPSHPLYSSNLAGGQTVQDRLNAWEQFKAQNPNAAFANNANVDKQITHLITTIENPTELHTAINNIDTQIGLDGIPKEYADKMAKDGYIAIVPTSHNLPVVPFSETTGKLATNAAEGGFFTRAAQPVPVLQSVGTFLTWAGLSPDVAWQRVQSIFEQQFTAAAGQFGFLHLAGDTAEVTGKDTLQKLYNYMKAPTGGFKVFGHYLPINDLRQLTTGDIQRALGVSKEEAKQVGDAIMQAYLDVPRQVAGLGNKVLDRTFQLNPLAPTFSRVQSALRFAWNPIFTQARLPLKEEFLVQMETGGKFPTVAGTNRFMQMFFPGQYKELNTIIDNPDFKTIVGGGLGAEADAAATGAADFAHAEVPPKTTLLPIAGLVKHMADNAGVDAATFMQKQPQAVQDAVQAVLHYDRNNSFLNSPLAKTLNMAFFPFRFNLKVSSYMARAIAKQPPSIQYAVIKGMLQGQAWLKSPQGQAWYATHSDAIGLFKYFSPLETLSTFNEILSHPGSISSYGELGGLPFGWIPQLTDAVGMTHFGQPYVNPKTGAIAKEYVPTSMYGALNAAIQDLVGALYTYPGATAGLPSKGSIDRTVANNLLPGSSKDFNKTDNPNITPQDQQFSQIAQQVNGVALRNGTPQATPQTSSSVSVPTSKSSLENVLPKSTSGTRLKKSQIKPALLPGQTTLGQL